MGLTYYIRQDRPLTDEGVVRFKELADAITHYRSLPLTTGKALGTAWGIHTTDLVRCLPTRGDEYEDVLVPDFLSSPMWKDEPEIRQAAETLVEELRIRYCLYNGKIIPAPTGKDLPDRLQGKYLWPDDPDDIYSAIQWLYVSGTGWLSRREFERRYPHKKDGGVFSFPLVLTYRAHGLTARGEFTPLNVTPWEYQQLIHRTKARIKNNTEEENHHE